MAFGKKNAKTTDSDAQKLRKYLLLAFGCSALILVLVYFISRILPVGKITILRMDLYHQYGPLFAELYERITHGDSLIYSWCSGLGSCFLGNYFNYMSSPIAAIIMLFGHNCIPEAIAAMVLIKAGLSSASFNYYLSKSLGKLNYSTVAFGVMYSFCGYFLAYYWNVMWIDAMVLLPLVAYGIERIINTGKMRTYVTALALTMLSNYYMSFMMCVFSVIYFFIYFYTNYHNGCTIAKLQTEKKPKLKDRMRTSRFFRSGLNFVTGSVIAAGIIAFALIPTYIVLQATSATSGNAPEDLKLYFKAFDFIANHLSGIDPTIRSSGEDVLPNVFCGMLTVLLIPLYIMTKSISKKEKTVYISMLGLFYIGFNLNLFNFIWHGLHFPNDLPYRQSFMYTFILLIMAYKTFIRLKELSSRQIAAAGIGVALFIIIAQKVGSKNLSDSTVYISLFFTVLYTLVLVFFKDRRYTSVGLAGLLLVCACSEVLIADTGSYDIDQPKANYASDLKDFESVKDYLDELEDGDFYRMELTKLRARMDPCWYYYNGVSTFSSMAYENLASLQHKLGMFGNTINSYTYYPQTPVYNAMFGLKYIVNNTDPDVLKGNTDYYSYLTTIDKFTAYENDYTLPIGYAVSDDIMDWSYSASNPFEVQGSMFALATGTENPFKDLAANYVTYSNMKTFTESLDGHYFSLNKVNSAQEASCTFYFTQQSSGNLYLYFDAASYFNKAGGEGTIKIEGADGTITQNMDVEGVIDTGYHEKGEIVTATFTLNSDSKDTGNLNNFYAVTMDSAIFKEGYNKLERNSLNVTKFDDTVIEGSFTADEDGIFFTSIPYDKGWQIYVDGEKADYAVYDEDKDSPNYKQIIDENSSVSSANDTTSITEAENNNDVSTDTEVDYTGKVVRIGYALIGVDVSKGEHDIKLVYKAGGLSGGIKISVFMILLVAAYFLLKRYKYVEKINKLLRLPAYPEYSSPTLTTDLFVGGNDAYDEQEKLTENAPVHAPLQREVIAPPTVSASFKVTDVPAERTVETTPVNAVSNESKTAEAPVQAEETAAQVEPAQQFAQQSAVAETKAANVQPPVADSKQPQQNNDSGVYHAVVDNKKASKESMVDKMRRQRKNK